MVMLIYYLGLGSNLGNKVTNCTLAIERLSCLGDVISASSMYRTEPVGIENQPEFVNAAFMLKSKLSPYEMLREIQLTELQMGRIRKERWGPREIDIDLLFVEEFVIQTNFLTVPHPYAHKRRFVLQPLSQIAPELVHPKLRITIKELLVGLKDDEKTVRIF